MPFTVADYILQRLSEQKVDTLFGVPAAYCAPLFDAANAHGMRSIVTASDLEAGYAADGYARTKGLGAVSVAYGVGTLSMINAIAGAYVERSPVLVINGGPTAANLANLHQFDILFSPPARPPKHRQWSMPQSRQRLPESGQLTLRSTSASGTQPVRCRRGLCRSPIRR